MGRRKRRVRVFAGSVGALRDVRGSRRMTLQASSGLRREPEVSGRGGPGISPGGAIQAAAKRRNPRRRPGVARGMTDEGVGGVWHAACRGRRRSGSDNCTYVCRSRADGPRNAGTMVEAPRSGCNVSGSVSDPEAYWLRARRRRQASPCRLFGRERDRLGRRAKKKPRVESR